MISGKRWKIFSIAAIIWYSTAYEIQDWEFFITSLVGHSFLYIMQQDLCRTWSCDISFSLSRNIMENLKPYNAFWIGSHLYVAGWIHLPMWMELWVKTWDTVMCWVSFKFWIQFLFISAAKWRMIIILLQGLSKTWVTSANKQVYLIHVLVLDVFFNPNIW
jgi:hypothetical protein